MSVTFTPCGNVVNIEAGYDYYNELFIIEPVASIILINPWTVDSFGAFVNFASAAVYANVPTNINNS